MKEGVLGMTNEGVINEWGALWGVTKEGMLRGE
jgi:hypothetical protein